jgi:hypothetical protein
LNQCRTKFNTKTIDLLVRFLGGHKDKRETGVMTVYEAWEMLEGLRVKDLDPENYHIDELIKYLVEELCSREEQRGVRQKILALHGRPYWFIYT